MHPPPLGQQLTGGNATVDSVAFSPGGRMPASGSADGTTRLWNLNVQYVIGRICATAASPGSGTSTSPSCGTNHPALISVITR